MSNDDKSAGKTALAPNTNDNLRIGGSFRLNLDCKIHSGLAATCTNFCTVV